MLDLRPAMGRLLDSAGRGRRTRGWPTRLAVGLVAMALASGWHLLAGRRVWRPGEVPIAFWVWQTRAPDEADVRRAVGNTTARSLFVHAGQIGREGERLCRDEPLEGTFPTGVDLHLVYNADERLLATLDSIDP